MHTLIGLNANNTLFDTTQLRDATYREIGRKELGIEVPMLTSPVDGSVDGKFSAYDLTGIWQYKISEMLDAGIPLRYKGKEVFFEDEIDIAALTAQFPTVSRNILERDGVKPHVKRILSLEDLARIKSSTRDCAVSIITANCKEVQEYLLQELGYFDIGIDPELCIYGERKGGKATAFAELFRMCYSTHNEYPHTFVYIGDAPSDMEAVERSNQREIGRRINHNSVGVLSSPASKDIEANEEMVMNLGSSGARLILNTLASSEDVTTLIKEVNRWKHER